VPDDVAQLGRIDPRIGTRVVISAGYSRPDGTADVHQLGDLGLRRRPVARPDNRMTLTCYSDEALVADAGASVTGTLVEVNTLNGIATLIRQVLPAAAIDYTALTNAGPAVNQSTVDIDRMDVISDLADQIAAQVYDDGSRQWVVRDVPQLGAVIALEVAHGAGGTLVESDADLSRDDGYANWVVLRYIWTDGSNVRQRIIGSRRITSGPYAANAGNIRILLIDRDTPTTQAKADAAAAALVARTVTRGRALTIRTPSAYWLRPGDTLRAQLVTGDPETCLAARVEFDLASGLMAVSTRLPDNTGTIGA
jgi:hypothetical protein